MVSVPLFRYTNMAAVTSRENPLYLLNTVRHDGTNQSNNGGLGQPYPDGAAIP